MKNILVIGMSDTLGGVETYLFNLIKGINKTDLNFDFLILGNGKSVFQQEINLSIGDGKNHFYNCPLLKKNFLKGEKWLKRFYNKHNYDIIYMNTCTSARIMYCLEGLRGDGTILISHSHNGKADNIVGNVNNFLFRGLTTKKSYLKLACSDIAYHYLYTGNPKGRWFVPNGINVNRFKFNALNRKLIRKKYEISSDTLVLGCVGRFTKQKNQTFLIQLSKIINRDVKFLLLGNGELKNIFIDELKNNNINDKFILLDAKNDVEKYYSAFDLLLMPSLFEGLPITAIEAQCNGMDCLLSNKITKQVKLSNHCKFFSLDNINAWSDYINNFKAQRYEGETVVKSNGFDEESTISIMTDVFENL